MLGSATSGSSYTLEPPPVATEPSLDAARKQVETRIRRGFSKAIHNEQLVREQRTKVLEDISESSDTHAPFLQETPDYTFVLPDLMMYSTEFRAFLEKELVETSTMVSLEQSGHLNWWSDAGLCERLWPMATTGDGNCLLHAASLAMWGFHDRLLILRHALHHRLLGDESAFYRHWRWQATMENQKVGLTLSESEWESEWEALKRLSSPSPKGSPVEHTTTTNSCHCSDRKGVQRHIERSTSNEPAVPNERAAPPPAPPAGPGPLPNGSGGGGGDSIACYAAGGGASSGPYESLEHLHVFVLAHVIRRPIVVIADPMLRDADGEPLQPSPFGGVYLPLLDRPEVCHHDPLLLAYSNSHFSALVPMSSSGSGGAGAESTQIRAIPLVDWANQLLPVHFALDPTSQWRWGKDESDQKKVKKVFASIDESRLLERYLRCLRVSVPLSCSNSDASWGSQENEERIVVTSQSASSTLAASVTASNNNNNSSNSSNTTNSSNSNNNSNNTNNNNSNSNSNNNSNNSNNNNSNNSNNNHNSNNNSNNNNNNSSKSGSLGRTIGRQLKKALSVRRKSGSTTQSTRRPSSEWSSQSAAPTSPVPSASNPVHHHGGGGGGSGNGAGSGPGGACSSGVLCALIGQKLPPRYAEMLDNYLLNAEERFSALSVLHRRRSREIIARAEARRLSMSGLTACANAGCSMYSAGAETNFLCSVCFRAQQREAERLSGEAEARRSPSPSPRPSPQPRSASPSNALCRSKDCSFYGQAGQLGFCSRCYKKLETCKTPGCGRRLESPQDRLCPACYSDQRHKASPATLLPKAITAPRTSWL